MVCSLLVWTYRHIHTKSHMTVSKWGPKSQRFQDVSSKNQCISLIKRLTQTMETWTGALLCVLPSESYISSVKKSSSEVETMNSAKCLHYKCLLLMTTTFKMQIMQSLTTTNYSVTKQQQLQQESTHRPSSSNSKKTTTTNYSQSQATVASS